jgi:uncharacterized protein YheU (UPF0270 family)
MLNVMRERLVLRIEIDSGDALSAIEQRDRDMHRDRRLARAVLVASEHNDVRRRGLLRT